MLAVVTLSLALSLVQATPASTGRISGRVTTDANAPVSGARVIAIPAARPSATYPGPLGMPPQALTDQDGGFVFVLAPGEYRLDVQKTGYAPFSDPMIGPRPLTVAAGQAVQVDFRLQKGAVIAGRVLDPSGAPLSDMRVMAMRRLPSPGAAVPYRLVPAPMQGPQQTNDLGEFRVPGLAPGEYYVAAMRMGTIGFSSPAVTPPAGGAARTTYATTFYPGTVDETSAHGITAAAGAEVANIVITMQSAPAFRVSGFVVDETGNPVGRAMVMLMADRRSGGVLYGPAGTAQTQDDGRFVISDVPAGSYQITATVIMTSASGGVSGGAFMSFSSGGPVGGVEQPASIVVADADVRGVRVVARRPAPQ